MTKLLTTTASVVLSPSSRETTQQHGIKKKTVRKTSRRTLYFAVQKQKLQINTNKETYTDCRQETTHHVQLQMLRKFQPVETFSCYDVIHHLRARERERYSEKYKWNRQKPTPSDFSSRLSVLSIDKIIYLSSGGTHTYYTPLRIYSHLPV